MSPSSSKELAASETSESRNKTKDSIPPKVVSPPPGFGPAPLHANSQGIARPPPGFENKDKTSSIKSRAPAGFGQLSSEQKESKDTKEPKESKESKESKDAKHAKESKDTKDSKDSKDSNIDHILLPSYLRGVEDLQEYSLSKGSDPIVTRYLIELQSF